MTTNKMSMNLSKNKLIEEFANGASETSKSKVKEPWDSEDNNKRAFFRIFNLRLSNDDYNKLNYIAGKKRLSKNQVCLDVLLDSLDKIAREL